MVSAMKNIPRYDSVFKLKSTIRTANIASGLPVGKIAAATLCGRKMFHAPSLATNHFWDHGR